MKSRVITPAEARIIEEHLENGMLKLLCQVMRVAGLRVSDACGLKYNDINDNVLFVVEQKTGKSKRVVLPLWLVVLSITYLPRTTTKRTLTTSPST